MTINNYMKLNNNKEIKVINDFMETPKMCLLIDRQIEILRKIKKICIPVIKNEEVSVRTKVIGGYEIFNQQLKDELDEIYSKVKWHQTRIINKYRKNN